MLPRHNSHNQSFPSRREGGLSALLKERQKRLQNDNGEGGAKATGLAALISNIHVEKKDETGTPKSALERLQVRLRERRAMKEKSEGGEPKLKSEYQKLSQKGLKGLLDPQNIKNARSSIGINRLKRNRSPSADGKPKRHAIQAQNTKDIAVFASSSFDAGHSMNKYIDYSSDNNSLLTKIVFPSRRDENKHEARRKRQKLETQLDVFKIFTNNTLIGKKVASNFAKPSPDEVHNEVSQVTKGVSQLKVAEEKNNRSVKKVIATKPKTKINIQKAIAQKAKKPNLSFIMIGHVDSGKSTMIGRLLYDLHIVDSKVMHKLTQESERIGKPSFSLAWVMDQTPEERERGVTVDICETQFETDKGRYTVIDSPGHKDYVPQMINGVTQADIAVMIVDIASFKSGFGDNGQTKEHLTIAKSLGIDNCIICINKMDSIGWDKETFDSVKGELDDFLVEELHFKPANLKFVPTSGYLGDNIVKKSQNCSWYNGKVLMELLEDANASVKEVVDKKSEFAMTVNDLQKGGREGELTIGGRIHSGTIQPGETIVISPTNESGVVDGITVTSTPVGTFKMQKKTAQLAIRSEFVDLKLKKVDDPDDILIGDVATKPGHYIKPVKEFKCDINCFNLNRPLLVGTPFILFRGNISIPCRLKSIDYVVTASGKMNKKRKHLASSSSGLVNIEVLDRSIPMFTFKQDAKLGRVVLRRDGKTIGAGKVVGLVTHKTE